MRNINVQKINDGMCYAMIMHGKYIDLSCVALAVFWLTFDGQCFVCADHHVLFFSSRQSYLERGGGQEALLLGTGRVCGRKLQRQHHIFGACLPHVLDPDLVHGAHQFICHNGNCEVLAGRSCSFTVFEELLETGPGEPAETGGLGVATKLANVSWETRLWPWCDVQEPLLVVAPGSRSCREIIALALAAMIDHLLPSN